MPYIHAHIASSLGDEKLQQVSRMLGETISLLPGKSEANLMLRLDEQANLFYQGKQAACAMIEVHLFKASPREAKQAYSHAVIEQFCRITGLDISQVYLNFFEHEDWAAKGELIQR